MSLPTTSFADPAIEALLAQVLQSQGCDDVTDAESTLRNAVTRYPDEGRFWELLGIQQWNDGNRPEALNSLETASALRPLGARSQIILADCYIHLKKPNLAFMILYFLVKEDRCPTEHLPQLACALGGIDDNYQAALVCERLIERSPEHQGAYFGLAHYLMRDGHSVENVLPFLCRAYELQPLCLSYRVNYGLALSELGMEWEAAAILDQVHPQSIRCVNWLARLVQHFRRVKDSIRSDLFGLRILELS